jgi:hypothetical protein
MAASSELLYLYKECLLHWMQQLDGDCLLQETSVTDKQGFLQQYLTQLQNHEILLSPWMANLYPNTLLQELANDLRLERIDQFEARLNRYLSKHPNRNAAELIYASLVLHLANTRTNKVSHQEVFSLFQKINKLSRFQGILSDVQVLQDRFQGDVSLDTTDIDEKINQTFNQKCRDNPWLANSTPASKRAHRPKPHPLPKDPFGH